MITQKLHDRIRNGKGTSTDAEAVLNEYQKMLGEYQQMQDIIAMQKTKLDRLGTTLHEIDMGSPIKQPEINDYPSAVTHAMALVDYIHAEIARDALFGKKVE